MLRAFGTLRVDGDDAPVDLGSPKQRAVLTILALHSGRTIATDTLIDAIWGETPPRTAAHSVQIYVSELRKALASTPELRIETARPGYRLNAPQAWVDVAEFERLVALGTGSETTAALHAAMALWVGEPLSEFRNEAWARPHIERLLDQRAEAAVRLAATSLVADPHAALRWAETAVTAAPHGERGCELMMLSLYRLGRHVEALRTYEAFRQRLDDELGLVPTPALIRLHQQVLLHDEDLEAPSLVVGGGRGASSRRRRIAIGWAVCLVGLVGGVTIALAGESDDPPQRHALLLHNVLSQVRLQAEAGFEDGLKQSGLTGSTLTIDQTDAVAAALDAEVDLVVVPAVQFDLGDAASAHPDTYFVAVDQVVDGSNVSSVIVNSHETSYLAGVAAALTTTTGMVGFVGGVDEELIWEFEAGFVAGVEATDPSIDVLIEFLAQPPDFGRGYENAPGGEAAARRMYTAGADVIFAAAGTSGLGVFEAAADLTSETGHHLWAIGVDTDQYLTVRDLPLSVDPGRWQPHILTSVLKYADIVTRDAVIQFAKGELEPGTRFVGLAEGSGGLSYSGGFLDEHREELERLRAAIVAGEIDVPCRPVERLGRSSPQRAHPCG